MTASQMIAAHTKWIGKNPLRRWRKLSDMSPNVIASALGVTRLTIYAWETGGNSPNEENMTRLAVAMNTRDLAERWAEWLKERPAA